VTTTPFGSLLREARNAKGMSQRDLATALGFSSPYVSDVESGRRNPFSDENLSKISSMLDVSLERLKRAANVSRGFFTLPTASTRHNEVAAILAERWTKLKPSQLDKILRAVA